MHSRLDTVVIPNAGRSGPLPGETGQGATLLGLAMDEAAQAGARRIVVVGDGRIPSVRNRSEVVAVPQVCRHGLGGALLAARPHVGAGPVGVILPDELILGGTCLGEMTTAYRRAGAGHMVGIAEVPPADTARYGIVDPLDTVDTEPMARLIGIVEKPPRGAAPSRLAVVGRYLLHARIFDDLKALGSKDPLCLTEGIAAGLGRVGLIGFAVTAQRFDCSRPTHLMAAIAAMTAPQRRPRAIAAE